MSSTHLSTHLKNNSEVTSDVDPQGPNCNVVNLRIDELRVTFFDHIDRGHGLELADALVAAGEQLRSIYRAREVAEYDAIREEEEWEWAAREAAYAAHDEAIALGLPADQFDSEYV